MVDKNYVAPAKTREHEDFYEVMPATMDNMHLVIDDRDRDSSSWSFLLWLVVPIALAAVAISIMSIGSKPVDVRGNAEIRTSPVGSTNTSAAETSELPAAQPEKASAAQ